MMNWLNRCFLGLKNRVNNFLTKEDGGSEIIAIILVIVVIIALAVIFRDQLTGIVNKLFGRISGEIDSF